MKKYTPSHEWILEESQNEVTVGISEHARDELGDIVYVELPAVGDLVELGEEIVVIESTKAAADIYAPLSGEVVEINEAVRDNPDLIKQSPEDKGWLFKLKLTNPSEENVLLSKKDYLALISDK